jgi:hypothetical protein
MNNYNIMESSSPSPQLAKVYADSTNKRFTCTVFAISLVVIIISYLISAFALPSAFIQIEGPENCPRNISSFTGFCHYLEIANGKVWQSFVKNLEESNSFIAVGANAIRNDIQDLSCKLKSHRIQFKIYHGDYAG